MAIIIRIRKYLSILEKRQKRNAGLLLAMMIIGAGLEVIGVSMMIPLMNLIMDPDIFTTNGLIVGICSILHIESYRSFVLLCVVAMISIYILKNAYLIFQTFIYSRYVYNVQFFFQQKIYKSYLYLPYERYLNLESGHILRTIQDDVIRCFESMNTLLSLISESLVTIALVAAILFIQPVMTLAVAGVMALVGIIIVKVMRPKIKSAGEVFWGETAASNRWILESIQGIKEIKIAGTETYFSNNYQKSGRKRIKGAQANYTYSSIPRMVLEVAAVCTVLSVMAVMLFCGVDISSLIPALSAFAMAAVKLLPGANRIVGSYTSLSYSEPAVNNTIECLKKFESVDRELNIKSSDVESLRKWHVKDAVELRCISYSYPGSERKVLENASMTVPGGKSVGVIGVSGGGKTTAIDIMLGLLSPQSGQVTVDGRDINDNYNNWLSCIGYIPQTMFMMDDSIRENIVFGREVDKKAIKRVIKEAQLEDFVNSLPDGLDTSIGDRGIRLSGGQRQRIGIARALYSDPDILVFDEATSALDNQTEAAIMESIESLHGLKTMIIIAHRLETIKYCDMVYKVEGGKIERVR